jgi:predicted nuclease with TOPRIM domain
MVLLAEVETRASTPEADPHETVQLLEELVAGHATLLERRHELEAALRTVNDELQKCEQRSARVHAVLSEDAA